MFWFIKKEYSLHSWKAIEQKRHGQSHTRSHKLEPGYPVLQASVLLTVHSVSALGSLSHHRMKVGKAWVVYSKLQLCLNCLTL